MGHGLDESYDCDAEMLILQRFLASLSEDQCQALESSLDDPEGPPQEPSVDFRLACLFRQIGKTCSAQGRQRHLCSMLPTREKWYKPTCVGRAMKMDLQVSNKQCQALEEKFGDAP